MYKYVEQAFYLSSDLTLWGDLMPEEKKKIGVDNQVTKIMNKMGITGIASALFTAILGLFIILYEDFHWEHFRLIIGLYLLIVGVMNITGYVISLLDKRKENIYIETETLKTK